MKFTFVSPDGTETVFSRDAVDYKLLKRYSGLFEIPVEFQEDKSPYQHGTTLLPGGTLMTPRDVSFDILIMALETGTTTVTVNLPSNNTSVFGDAVFGDMIFGEGDSEGGGESYEYSTNLNLLQTRIYNLARALSPLEGPGILYYEREDGTQYRLNCSNDNSTLDPDERSDVHQKATIRFRAQDPFWYSGTPNIETFGADTVEFFPFNIPWYIGASSNQKSLTNAGNVSAPVDILIWGPITDPVLTNVTTGEALTLDLELLTGDLFRITTGKNRITALYTPASTGVEVNGQGYITVGSKFWLLQKGVNTVTFSCSTSSTGHGASVSWSDQYAGVF
jgi:hypothetical protein